MISQSGYQESQREPPLSHCTPVFPKEGSHTEAPTMQSKYSSISGLSRPSEGTGEREGAQEER